MANEIDLSDADTLQDIGLNPSPGNDVARMLTAASQIIASYVGHPLHRRTGVVEYPACNGGPYLFLKSGAVTAITSIVVDGATVPATSYRLDSAFGRVVGVGGYSFPFVGTIFPGVAPEPYYAVPDGRIVVTFDAGYVTPGQVALAPMLTRTLPMDIEQACIELVTGLYRTKGQIPDLQSYSLGDASITYGQSVGVMGTRARAMLAPHRNIARRVFG